MRQTMTYALGLALMLAACGGEPEATELEAAFCSDLESGLSFAQLVPQVRDHMTEQGRSDPEVSTALWIEDAIQHCPEHREMWESNILYEEWIAEAG